VSRILLAPHRIELIEKQSRFLGIGYPCRSLESFKLQKQGLEREFPDASHITFAYKFFENSTLQQRFSDDGEPSGTAGKPIMMHIEGRGMINIALFVVRYFGGTKLGAGGLVRAYGGAAKQLLLEAPSSDYVPTLDLVITLSHKEQQLLDYHCRKFQVEILERIWDADLKVRLRMPEHQKSAFLAALNKSEEN
jgi:uncharacterized YigZ family protein